MTTRKCTLAGTAGVLEHHLGGAENRGSLEGARVRAAIVRMAVVALLLSSAYQSAAFAQEHQNSSPSPAAPATQQFPGAKQQNPASESKEQNTSGVTAGSGSRPGVVNGEKDSPEAIRKRAEWFYKQRSSVAGRIPAGARLQALQHMQRMMEAEGKLVRRADGSYTAAAETTAGAAAGTSAGTSAGTAWTPIGPTPTTGGDFSPVTGRITTIAVDPSDPSGNTVLIGGAQGGIWRSLDAGITWTPVGDQNASLAMGSIAFAPSSPSTVYAGTGEQAGIGFDIYYGAGVLKSTDGGRTWAQTCTTPGTTCPFIGPYTDGFFGSPGFGYFNFGGARISYVAVSPSNANLVLVGAQFVIEGPKEGVYCSDNGGTTWSNVLPDEMATFVGFASGSVAYAALGNTFGNSPGAPNGNGIYKATGIGSSCSSITFKRVGGTGLPSTDGMGRIDLGLAAGDANTVYASIADAATGSNTTLGVYLTTNGGTNWTQTAAPDVCQDQCWYDDVIKVDPTNKQAAFFGGSAVVNSASSAPSWVVRTQNGGTSWTPVIPNSSPGDPGLPHVDTHAMAFVKLPGGKVRLYLGNDGGIWRTDDAEAATVTWTNLNGGGLTLSQFYPSISIHPSSSQVAFGGTQDNGSQNYQGGTAWTDNGQCGDGTSTGIDLQIPSTVYVTCPNFGGGFPLFASYQGGAPGTFFLANNGINPTDSANFVAPLAVDPNSADVLYFGTTQIYQSLDAGNSWSPIGGQLAGGNYDGDYLTSIAVAPGNSSVVYAGSSRGYFFSSNSVSSGFGDFTQHPNGLILPNRSITAFAIDRSDGTGNTAYVSVSGFSFVGTDISGNQVNEPYGHVFKTVDGGFNLADVSCSVANCSTPGASDLPNIPVNDLVLDPDVPGILYAATDLGVYVGNCTTTPCAWSTLGTGLPHVAVLSLRLHEASRTLRAATHGRGVWDLALNNFTFTGPRIFSLSPLSTNASGTTPVTLTVNGTGLTGGAVEWNGATTGVTTQTGGTDTMLTATIDPSLLSGGTAQVAVTTAAAASNAVPFEVLAQTPTLTGINPSSVPVETPNPATNTQIQVTGTNFANTAKVYLNGLASGITATVNSSASLTATLPARLLGPYGSTNDVTVVNTPPGGGKSQEKETFRVLAPPPPNDNIANAIVINSVYFVDTKDSSGATTESTDPVPPCAQQFSSAQGNTGGLANGLYNTIWYSYTPLISSNLYLDTMGSSYDTVLSVWTGSPGSLTNVACNDDITPGVVIQSRIQSAALTANTTYYIMVSSFGPPDPNPIALGGKTVLTFTFNNGQNPSPQVSSLSPTSAHSGDPGFTLTVNGTLFLSGATVQFNNQAEPTTYISPTQVTAQIPASAILFPGTYAVSVFNTNGGFVNANSVNFQVTLGVYPVPVILNVNPTSVVAGGLTFGMLVNGSNFVPQAATLDVNGVSMPTNAAYSGQVSANVSAAAIATPGTAQITVVNPGPGGGPSAPVTLTITAPAVVPTITGISPNNFIANYTLGTETLTGTNFQTGAYVNFAGATFPTNVISSTQLTFGWATPLPAAGTYPVYVIDPSPAGTSAPFNITINPTPPTFVMTGPTQPVTVSAGHTVSFPVTIGGMNGFNGNVTVSCVSSAPETTCGATPNPVSAGNYTTTIMLTTTGRGGLTPGEKLRWITQYGLTPLVLLTLALWILAVTRTAPNKLRGWKTSLPLLAVAMYLVLHALGCGGGSGNGIGGNGGGGAGQGTPPGGYSITITGTSGTFSTQIIVILIVD